MRLLPSKLALAAGLSLAVVAVLAAGRGGEPLPGPIPAELIGVVDGDTVDVRARIWLGHAVETRVRLAGIDAPEPRGDCEAEKAQAARARDRPSELLAGERIVLRDIRFGKFAGRVLARVETVSGMDPAAVLLAEGLARPYDGGARDPWCAARQ